MKRGQAFETMMLVISVIVALAILSILLNILGGVNAGFGVGNPVSVIEEGLKNIQSKGYGITTPKKATFEREQQILVGEVIRAIPVDASEVKFACKGTICGTDKINVEDSGASFLSKARLEGFIVVCGDDTQTPKYCVGVGREAADAREACTSTCHM
ncbi:MAG: hypothetical protein V1717_02935 [Candidatus Micrarchaeota archaeon]